MKKFLITQAIEAEPMTRKEAEERIGHKINYLGKEEDGFLVCDMTTLKWTWVPKKKFTATPFDSLNEKAKFYHELACEAQVFFKSYNKSRNVSDEEKMQVYLINRHLKPLSIAISKLLNYNLIKTTLL